MLCSYHVNPIAQTSAASGQPTPQGNLAAMGVANINGIGFVKSFTEHTIILGFACVTGDITYQQGLNKMFSRRTRYDFYWPDFANSGEQAVLSKEIYCDGSAGDDTTFGFQERYAEYRYKPAMITGKFRSTDSTPLHYTLFSFHYSLFSRHYTLFSPPYSFFPLHYTLFSFHYSLFPLHCTLLS